MRKPIKVRQKKELEQPQILPNHNSNLYVYRAFLLVDGDDKYTIDFESAPIVGWALQSRENMPFVQRTV
jgi:hypothetical protein